MMIGHGFLRLTGPTLQSASSIRKSVFAFILFHLYIEQLSVIQPRQQWLTLLSGNVRKGLRGYTCFVVQSWLFLARVSIEFYFLLHFLSPTPHIRNLYLPPWSRHVSFGGYTDSSPGR